MDGCGLNGYNGERELLLDIEQMHVSYVRGRRIYGRRKIKQPGEGCREEKYREDILKGVNLSVKRGCLTALLGKNGSGKTTLLKSACGLTPVRRGRVTICGRDLKLAGRREIASCISYIPQKNSIMYHIKTDEVVAMGVNPRLNWYETPSAIHRQEAHRILEQMGLGKEADRDFLALSEGQKQLALFCRVLMQNAPMMLFDEPDSALDYENKKKIFSRISAVIKENNYGGLLTLQDPDYALNYCDKIMILKDGLIKETIDCMDRTERGRVEAERKLRIIYPEIQLLRLKGHILTVK